MATAGGQRGSQEVMGLTWSGVVTGTKAGLESQCGSKVALAVSGGGFLSELLLLSQSLASGDLALQPYLR